MSDIIENDEIDKDTVEAEVLEQQFSCPFQLTTEISVSLKKSYIKNIHGTKSLKLAVSVSDNSIEIYELNKTSLNKVCRLSGHSKSTSQVVFSPKEEHQVYSCGQDGVIKLWDTRTSGSCVQEYKDEDDQQVKPFDCMDVSCTGRVLCGGTQLVADDAYLVFWDSRQTKPLGGYWNSHTDDITQVRFHKDKPGLLSTGSLDGLLNIFNIMEQTEDDALTYSLNVENSVERLSWLNEASVACVTQSNDLQIWNAETGDMERSFGRDKVAKSIRRSREDDCYLVDAFSMTDGTQVLLAGSNGGDGNCLRSVSMCEKRLQPRTNFAQNKQTVSCCYYEPNSDTLVTAGESGLISVWQPGTEVEASANNTSGKLTNKMNKLHVTRHKPY